MSFICYKLISEGSVQSVSRNRESRRALLQYYQQLLQDLRQQRQRLIELENLLHLNHQHNG